MPSCAARHGIVDRGLPKLNPRNEDKKDIFCGTPPKGLAFFPSKRQ
jgi:hypothetical protein